MKDHEADEQAAFNKCIGFLNSIGIETTRRKIDTGSFLPGFLIDQGVLVIDTEPIANPGDILHEAGHIAVVAQADRWNLSGASISKRKDREAEELMAIAWSYAACIHLQIDPFFVFHEQGYKMGSTYIIDNCEAKTYYGLRLLESIGMTAADDNQAKRLHIPSYPHMIHWLRA